MSVGNLVPGMVSIIYSSAKLNEPLVQGVGYCGHTLLYDHLCLPLITLQLHDVPLKTATVTSKFMDMDKTQIDDIIVLTKHLTQGIAFTFLSLVLYAQLLSLMVDGCLISY